MREGILGEEFFQKVSLATLKAYVLKGDCGRGEAEWKPGRGIINKMLELFY
jgi:hypothetical protein